MSRPAAGRPETPRRERTPSRRGGQGLTVLLALLAGFAGAFAYEQLRGDDQPSQAPITAGAQQPSNDTAAEGALTPAEIYERTSPGVVLIQAVVTQPVESPFGDQDQQGLSTGTGFVVSDEGFIVTNAHVVLGARRATVTFGEDREIDAEIKGVDLNSDLAVLKVDPKDHKLQPLALGTAKELRVGDPVVAIGNPFGLDRTLTTGVVSALARKIQGLNGFTISNVVQTDAAINKGNSGGPLLDAQGRVIGVNSQIQTESGGNVGIGFAVPVDKLKEVLPTLEDGKEVQVAFLGVTTVPIDAQRAKVVKVREGLLIAAITPKSPAQKAGLKAGDSGVTFDVDGSPVDLGGDIILKVDGKVFDTPQSLQEYIGGLDVGDEVDVLFERSGKRKRLSVTLAARPAQPATQP